MARTTYRPRIPTAWLICLTTLCAIASYTCTAERSLLGVRLVRQIHRTAVSTKFGGNERRWLDLVLPSCDHDREVRSAHSRTGDEAAFWNKESTAHHSPTRLFEELQQERDDDEYTALLNAPESLSASPRASTRLVRSSGGEARIVQECISQQTAASGTSVKKSTVVTPTTPSQVDPATARGGASAAATKLVQTRPLVFWENMVCGAVSRSIAQTIMHPANTMKTILQSRMGVDRPTIRTLAQPSNFKTLTRGAGANFVLSVPHGAINFAVLELIRFRMNKLVEKSPMLSRNADRLGPGLDFLSSALSTICCSVVSTPQMMITDNIMAGNYQNLPDAVVGLAKSRGVKGFYAGWWPGLAGKIPSYALTWTFFQQLKRIHANVLQRDPFDLENSAMGCLASAITVCIMIPMDTIKTRLVTQTSRAVSDPYTGIVDCAMRVFREEGMGAFYRGLAPRLVSVVPMIGIQFGVYEFSKRIMLERTQSKPKWKEPDEEYGVEQALEEVAMEVAADQDQPFPAPHFRKQYKVLFHKDRKGKKPPKSA